MFQKMLLPITCIAVLATFNTKLSADVVDFNSNPDFTYFVTPIFSGGFTFTDLNSNSFGTAENLDNSSASNGTVHLMDWTNNGTVSLSRMERTDGASFTLSSFDFTSGYLDGTNTVSDLTVRGYDSAGIELVSAAFTSVDYSEMNFTNLTVSGFDDLSYVTFEGIGDNNRMGFDNFVVSNIPEPSSLAVFGTGLCVLLRRRSRG